MRDGERMLLMQLPKHADAQNHRSNAVFEHHCRSARTLNAANRTAFGLKRRPRSWEWGRLALHAIGSGYLIATAFGGEAIPPRRWSGTDTSMNS
jgi:hypothetical protein